MEFGRATEADKMNLGVQDFILPEGSQDVLREKSSGSRKVYIGLPKWGRAEYTGEGKLYPPMTREKEFPKYYVQHFNSIEFNTTHYKIYPKESVEKWRNIAGDRDFIFCPKMYQGITHRGSLKGKSFLTGEFLDGVAAFGEHLGPVFIQVSETYSINRKDELIEYLSSLPTSGFEYFLEVRHASWFKDKSAFDFLVQQLTYLKIGLVISDTVGRRDVIHMTLTVPKIMIRFGWMSVPAIDEFRILEWKKRLDEWFALGLKQCFFFLHVSYESETVEFARWVQGVLGNTR